MYTGGNDSSTPDSIVVCLESLLAESPVCNLLLDANLFEIKVPPDNRENVQTESRVVFF